MIILLFSYFFNINNNIIIIIILLVLSISIREIVHVYARVHMQVQAL